jgi:hypothetical protein
MSVNIDYVQIIIKKYIENPSNPISNLRNPIVSKSCVALVAVGGNAGHEDSESSESNALSNRADTSPNAGHEDSESSESNALSNRADTSPPPLSSGLFDRVESAQRSRVVHWGLSVDGT